MEIDLIRHLLERIYGRFSFYNRNNGAIEAKIGSSGVDFCMTKEEVEDLIDSILDRTGFPK